MLIKINGSFRIFRGGGWNDYAIYCEVASRSYGYPCRRNYDIGFRVLRRCVYVNKDKWLLPYRAWQ